MTDNSNFVLRWEIDNSAETLATGHAESEVFHHGGFEWRAGVHPSVAEFTLTCQYRRVGNWTCEADIRFKHAKHPYSFSMGGTQKFNDEGRTMRFPDLSIFNKDHTTNGKVIIEFRINIISSDCANMLDLGKFSSPNEVSNVTLVIEEKKLKVSKDMLAIHSPVFATMFFGNFEEKGKEEVELKDIVYEEFIDLLNLFYLGTTRITNGAVDHILKLADQFQIERLLSLSVEHLRQTEGLDVAKKLLLADQYRLTNLRDHCLELFTCVNDVEQKVKSSPEYANFSADMKAAISTRINRLNRQMADNSTLVLPWVIDNAVATFATGKAESRVIKAGGFNWTVTFERRTDTKDKINFMLRCDSDHNGPWKCEAELSMHVLENSRSGASYVEWEWYDQGNFCFDANNRIWLHKSDVSWFWLTDQRYLINDKFSAEFHIIITSSDRGEPIVDSSKFAAPNNMSNVILKIGDGKLHVSKEMLAIHSPVFTAMFFGDFAEKEKEEVQLKDVEYEEFIDLLNVIYVRTMEITDLTVQHILKLADQFQMEDILVQSRKYLLQSKGIDVMTKMMLADQYRLVSLREHCLQSFKSVSDLTEKLNSCANFSEGMKAAIYDRIMKLSLQ